MSKEAMKLALEALEIEDSACRYIKDTTPDHIDKAITALREALAAQPAQQEPVAWMNPNGGMLTAKYIDNFASGLDKEIHSIPLYTSPPAQRTWVGLTDVEWMNIVNKDQAWFGQRPDEVAHEVAKLVEAKLKEKNT